MGWLLVMGLKECLVECAALCIKSEVMLSQVSKALCVTQMLNTVAEVGKFSPQAYMMFEEEFALKVS